MAKNAKIGMTTKGASRPKTYAINDRTVDRVKEAVKRHYPRFASASHLVHVAVDSYLDMLDREWQGE